MVKSPGRKEYSGIPQQHNLLFPSEKSGGSLYDGHHLHHPLENETPGGDNLIIGGRHESSYPTKGQIMKQSWVVIVLVALPLLLVAIILGWVIIPCFIRHQISNKVAISPDINPELYSAWLTPPVPVYLKIYIFNVTNSEDVRRGSLPALQECGPFVFLENRTKVDISHDEASDTITYKEFISYHFRPEMSGKWRLEDVVTIVNVPFAAAAIKIAHDLPWPLNDMAQTLLTSYKEPLFLQKTVDQALFTGWTVPFLQKIEDELGVNLIPNNRFGFFVGQNATAHGPYTISRGINDKASFGQILRFKNESTLSVWGDPSTSCNQITGTDGTIFSPFVSKATVLRLFNAEICRSLYLTYEKDTSFKGIKGYRFTAPMTILKDPRESKENECFCSNDLPEFSDKCLKQGALHLGPCRDEAPIAMSTPHFLDADLEYINMSGLRPNRKLHETFMKIEPLTGVILQASKKIQINLVMKRVKGLSMLRRVPEQMLFPLVWADECAELDEEYGEKLRTVLGQLWVVDFVGKWGLLGVALVVALVFIVRKLRRKDEGATTHYPQKDREMISISKQNGTSTEASQQIPLRQSSEVKNGDTNQSDC